MKFIRYLFGILLLILTLLSFYYSKTAIFIMSVFFIILKFFKTADKILNIFEKGRRFFHRCEIAKNCPVLLLCFVYFFRGKDIYTGGY